MRIRYCLIFVILISSAAQAQFHKPSVNLFKQQTKAIQNALEAECPKVSSGDSTNAFNQNIKHPYLNSAPNKTYP
jgi:hypothetical protein